MKNLILKKCLLSFFAECTYPVYAFIKQKIQAEIETHA